MNFAAVKTQAQALFAEASFLSEIKDEADYENALALMDELIEDYDQYRVLIGVLSRAIEQWENQAPEFADFNQRIAQLDDGVAIVQCSRHLDTI